MPDPAADAVHYNCLAALVTVIQGLSLYEIASANIGIQEVVSDLGNVGSTKVTGDDGNLAGSFISVSPWGAEVVSDFTNARDLTEYRCLVAIMAKLATPSLERKLEWREKIRLRLQNLKIGVTSIRKCRLELNPVIEASLWKNKQIYFSSMIVVCESIEARAA